eukprot:13332037-Alexandrium_andersonii.AAC.1
MDKGLFMQQAHGRGAWYYSELHRDPVKRDLPLDGVYKFDLDLLNSLGAPMRWGLSLIHISEPTRLALI